MLNQLGVKMVAPDLQLLFVHLQAAAPFHADSAYDVDLQSFGCIIRDRFQQMLPFCHMCA